MATGAPDGVGDGGGQERGHVTSFFEVFYTPSELATRQAIIEKIEAEVQALHKRIEPMLNELAKIRGTIRWFGGATSDTRSPRDEKRP